jgi:D-glycero-D-manno-heptose 1,7-bisphosphate phosphatase
MPVSPRALFLDRDGVINVDRGYVCSPEQFELVDGITDLCRHAVGLGYLLIVATNQAGIGRGYYTEADFLALTDWMCDAFRERGAPIAKVYYCPFHPEFGVGEYRRESDCRKPAPGMILHAARDFDLDLRRSVLVGDKESDIQAGVAAGVGCNVLYCPESGGVKSSTATLASQTATQLAEVVPLLNDSQGA